MPFLDGMRLSTFSIVYMPANLENSAVATGLEKVNFHSNAKERQCQRKIGRASELQSPKDLVCRLLLEKKNNDPHGTGMQDSPESCIGTRRAESVKIGLHCHPFRSVYPYVLSLSQGSARHHSSRI